MQYKFHSLLRFFIIIQGLFIASCYEQNRIIPGISNDNALKLFDKGTAIFLDVRTREEHQIKSIPNSIHIPLQELRERLIELEEYDDRMMVVYCRSGNRSAKGTKILLNSGFDAVNLLGGMINWKKTVQ